ncbi:MAG: hypothetical protein EAZ81_12765 [Verrucomicrobia bacterium]|nr:MAG: hypothetical protein EAZ81_12765 [Verrucomicrobiota bacterium]
MKSPFIHFALCALLSLTNVSGAEELSRQEMQKQLLLELKKDIANRLVKNNKGEQILASGITDVVAKMGPNPVSEYQIYEFDSHNCSMVYPESTRALIKKFRALLIKEIDTEKEKFHKEFKDTTRGLLIRALSADQVEEVAKVNKEWPGFLADIKTRDRFQQMQSIPSNPGFYELKRLFECLVEFQVARNEQSWYRVGKAIEELEKDQIHTKTYLSEEEYNGYLDKMRKVVGYLSLEEFDQFYQDSLNQLLDDANQDRIGEILANLRKQRSLLDHGNSNRDQRCGQLASLAEAMMRAIDSVREGAKPRISIESWTRSDGAPPTAESKEKLLAALGRYRVKVKEDDGKVTEARLYYPAYELRRSAKAILDELLDDANQDRLDEIIEKLKPLQSFADSSSEFYGVNQNLRQIESLAQSLRQMVKNVKRGSVARVNVDELLQYQSERNQLLDQKKFVAILKAYKVKVLDKNGKIKEEFLYQEASDVIARINQLSDIEEQLPALTQVSQSSYDSEIGNLPQAAATLAKLSEIHQNLESGASFTLTHHSHYDGRLSGFGVKESSIMGGKIDQLRNEAERAILARCFPEEKFDATGELDQQVAAILKKWIEEKSYQKVILLGRLVTYFEPKKSLFPLQEMFAMQHYLDGVRQMEELREPRLATGHFQQAAALRSSIIPVADLSQRLHQLKKENPAEYEQGTSDALKQEKAIDAAMSPQLMIVTPLQIPAR